MAITKFDQFDFLIDIVPRDDLKPPKRQVGTQRTLLLLLLFSKKKKVKSSKKPGWLRVIQRQEELNASPLLGAWRCCKHPWLEARGKASKGFQSDVCSVLPPLNAHSITINTKSPHGHPGHNTHLVLRHSDPQCVSPGHFFSTAALAQHPQVTACYRISD